MLPENINTPEVSAGIDVQDIQLEVEKQLKSFEPIPHNQLLSTLLEYIEEINFQLIAFPESENLQVKLAKLEDQIQMCIADKKESESLRNEREIVKEQLQKMKVKQKHYLIISIEHILALAKSNSWGICRNHDFVYLYNGAYWSLFDKEELQSFFGAATEKMGVSRWEARYYIFREQLFKQFLTAANLPKPEQSKETVLINLQNGTFEISGLRQELRPPDRSDFITYQLPFAYDPMAEAPRFQKYLDTVQPDLERQKILAEYLAYLFVKPSTLKLEKTLLLYGTGANGKSVFFEIVNALLGGEANVSNFSLQSLTNDNGYFRAKLANKLVNYASEINGKLETSIFKQLVSGEPVEARLPYGDPFTLTNYAKLIFNCNELPKDVEQTHAYFRRFLIVPFEITIPEEQQDKQLSEKIISSELSGVFNWVLDGLKRLLHQKCFTESAAVNKQLDDYKMQSDTVQLFLNEEGYEKSVLETMEFKTFFHAYQQYCVEGGYRPCSKKTVGDRLRNAGFEIEKKRIGMVIFIKKNSF